jgi:predicted ribosomally synthesized peptide with SipW-like signal peptide
MLIVGATGALTAGTSAFFSDTETSVGNTFAAGAIDLKIDNESYYNGVQNAATTWELVDLTIQKFFDFADVKPGDYGEDTVSIHVDTNDAYMCADVSLTSNEENGINEPEGDDGDTTDGEGELAGLMEFVWWADDGDNVLENDETVISQGPIGAIPLGATTTVVLADSTNNIWTDAPGPVSGGDTFFIGKAWCFGSIGAAPLAQSAYSGPDDDNNGNTINGDPGDGGISCDGSLVDNQSQTDSLTADVSFRAVQSRNNANFQCVPGGQCEFNEAVDLFVAEAKFENPVVGTPQLWDVFDSPVDGWTVEWRGDIPATFGPQNRPETAHLELHRGVLGSAFEGQQYAELNTDWGGPTDGGTGEPASVTIYRSFATVPGANYTLKFHFAPRPNTPAADNNLETRIDGVIADTTGPTAGGGGPIAWQERTVNFTASSPSTEIRFTDLGTANSLGTFLDNVRLFQTSCPAN